jgi:hypothetical protein
MKAKILGKVINRSEKTARFLNSHFELLAWIFFVLILGASVFAVRGVYLFYTTGNCNGVNNSGFCIFDPTGENNETSSTNGGACPVPTNKAGGGGLTLQGVDLSLWPVKNTNASNKVVFVGCYSCDYTRKVWPEIKALVEKFQPEFFFAEYPTKLKTDYLSKVGYCVFNQDQDKYWQMNDVLFAEDKSKLEDHAATEKILSDLGLNVDNVNACINDPATEANVQKIFTEVRKTNFYGTPTIFINGEPLVGPKPYRVYAIQMEGFFYWLK